ncbi:MAG: UvrD-helicase domain-containing protein [Synergistaceae bacterium]|nr:UvrD-helicase domain-containing protein [Synergistaceae bacterium]
MTTKFCEGVDAALEGALLRMIEGEREEQRLAIRSCQKLIVVSAGAGTGKTHTLARRFAWLLASDPTCRVEQILTLTFTHLAANEMRERIKSTLRGWYDSDRRSFAHLRDAIDRMDEACISTIHSFALRVIRESGLYLDIDPGSALIGEAVESEFWDEYAWNLMTLAEGRMALWLSDEWRGRLSEFIGSPYCVDFLNHFGARLIAKLAKDAVEVLGSMNGSPENLLNFSAESEAAVRRAIASSMSRGLRGVWDLWSGVIFPAIGGDLDGAKDAFGGRLKDLRDKWGGVRPDDDSPAAFALDLFGAALSPLPGKSSLKSWIEDEIGEKLIDWRGRYKREAEILSTLSSVPPYSDAESRARRMLLAGAAIGWEIWDAYRLRAGGLTFADLVRCAERILRLGGGYAARFRHVMVDEFQDTDGLQDAMISALASGVDGTLFIVGDIKQSIYRFRHADPSLFAAYIERAQGGERDATHIPLSCSYRMSGAMMKAVNRVFGLLWRDGVIESPDAPPVRYDPLLPPSDVRWWEERNSKSYFSPLEIFLYDCDGKTHIDEKRRRLASGVVRRLRKMVEGGEPIWDKKNGCFRPVRWGDMALLAPTRTPYRVIENVFEDAGVPVLFGSGREYFNRVEVRDAVNLLRALDEPWDDYALAGWIESPFSRARPGVAIDLEVLSGLPDLPRLGRSLWQLFSERFPKEASRFSALRRRGRLAGPSSALRALLEDQSWLAAYRVEIRYRVLSNIRRAVEIAADYESSFGANLSACADYLGRAMRGGGPMDEPSSSEAGGDFVQVKTIHASKGQEFPVVVIFGMELPVQRGSRAQASVSRRLGVVASKLPVLGGALTDGGAVESVTAGWHSFIEATEETEEKERLMYVAMTRAQERLICCAVHDGAPRGRDSWIDWLLRANEEAPGKKFPVTFVKAENDEASARADWQGTFETVENSAEPGQIPRPDGAVSLARLSATAYSLFTWCPVAYRMRYRQGRELRWEMPDGDGCGGADLGSLAHWALAKWDLSVGGIGRCLPPYGLSKDDEERARRRVPSFLRPVFASGRNREALRSWLSDFASTDECEKLRLLLSCGALRRELAFTLPFGGADLVGRIDVCWEDGDGFHVRDWKITQVDRAPDELYREQVNFYALVCRLARAAGDDAPVDAGLIHIRPAPSSEPQHAWSVWDWSAVERAVLHAAEAAASGPFHPAAERCPRCPFMSFCRSSRL